MTENVSRLPTAPARPPVPVHTFADLERMAKAVADSKLFGVQTPAAALSLMMLAQAEGRHPAQAARDFHILDTPQGPRPAMKADTMLARFQEAGGRVEWHELSNTKCDATFTHPTGGRAHIVWTWEDAERAKLPKQGDRGPNNWFKFPRAMLRSRCVSEGVRTVLPSVIVGIYTPEELADGDVEIRQVVTPATPPEDTAPADVPASVAAAATGEVTDAEIVPPTGLGDAAVDGHIAAIEGAADKPALVKAYNAAYRAAAAAKDSAAVAAFKSARDKRLAAITGAAA